MTPTSDERREVAARLRDDNHGYSTEYDFFLHALGMSREGRSPCDWAKVHERLADLIDPTCEMEPMPACVPSHAFSRWRCKSCGAVSFAPRPFGRPRFCQHCGARVVDEDD